MIKINLLPLEKRKTERTPLPRFILIASTAADDFVIGTGETHSVKEFIQTAFDIAGLKNWEDHITVDKRFYRPAEVDLLIADPSKANRKLGWKPKTSFKDLVKMMVENDIKFVERQIEGNQR